MREAFVRFLKGNEEAVALNDDLYQIAHLWDDLIDLDEPLTPAKINAAFYKAIVSVPQNRFYQQHFSLLNPLLEISILDWLAANEMEKSGKKELLRLSYVLRFSLQAFTVMCARIIGGAEWAISVNQEFRAMASPFEEYVTGLES